MTPEQFNIALEELELTQVGAAKVLGFSPRTARSYAAGDTPIPEPTAKLLRLLAVGKVKLEDVESV